MHTNDTRAPELHIALTNPRTPHHPIPPDQARGTGAQMGHRVCSEWVRAPLPLTASDSCHAPVSQEPAHGNCARNPISEAGNYNQQLPVCMWATELHQETPKAPLPVSPTWSTSTSGA